MPNETYGAWRKSSRSSPQGGNCVEIGFGETACAIRDTKEATNPNRPILEFTAPVFAGFLNTVKSGQLDRGPEH